MSRFRLQIEYDGTRYHGWQQNAGVKTVQGEIRKVCEKVFNTERIELYGAGRTDAGVHALGQVAHLEVLTEMPSDMIVKRLNDRLPHDIHILHMEACSDRFHARHDAIARSYVYMISRRRSAFIKHYAWWVKENLSVSTMQETSALLRGFHDFASFGATTPDEKSTRVNMECLDVTEQGSMILLHLIGSHFLWMMVRRIVGVLVHAGKGKMTGKEIAALLEQYSERPSQLAAPPSGLYLERIYYPGESLDKQFIIPVFSLVPLALSPVKLS